MKHLLLSLVLLVAAQVSQAGKYPGKIFWMNAKGDMASAVATIVHDTKANKIALVFRSKKGTKSYAPEKVNMGKDGTRPVLQMVFNLGHETGMEDHARIVFHGSLLAGKKAKIYYGDLYKVDADDISDDNDLMNVSKIQYVGGFGFHSAKQIDPKKKAALKAIWQRVKVVNAEINRLMGLSVKGPLVNRKIVRLLGERRALYAKYKKVWGSN